MSISNVTIGDGQNLFDVSLQTYGAIDYLFKLVEDNSISGIQATGLTGLSVEYEDTVKFENQNPVVLLQSAEKTLTVKDRQSIFDLSIQLYGDIEGAFDLIEKNPSIKNLDNNSLVGLKLNFTEQKKDFPNYFKVNNFIITSGLIGFVDGLQTDDGDYIQTDDGVQITID